MAKLICRTFSSTMQNVIGSGLPCFNLIKPNQVLIFQHVPVSNQLVLCFMQFLLSCFLLTFITCFVTRMCDHGTAILLHTEANNVH